MTRRDGHPYSSTHKTKTGDLTTLVHTHMRVHIRRGRPVSTCLSSVSLKVRGDTNGSEVLIIGLPTN